MTSWLESRLRRRRRSENIRLASLLRRSQVVSAGGKNRSQGRKNADKDEFFHNQVVTCLIVHSPQTSLSGVFNSIASARFCFNTNPSDKEGGLATTEKIASSQPGIALDRRGIGKRLERFSRAFQLLVLQMSSASAWSSN